MSYPISQEEARLQALSLAHDQTESPELVLKRAAAYFAFLANESIADAEIIEIAGDVEYEGPVDGS